jgi:hypothetical protein
MMPGQPLIADGGRRLARIGRLVGQEGELRTQR